MRGMTSDISSPSAPAMSVAWYFGSTVVRASDWRQRGRRYESHLLIEQPWVSRSHAAVTNQYNLLAKT